MAKQRIHNEYFMSLVKKTCPCGKKKIEVFAWGEYFQGKWSTVDHFCQDCFPSRILPRLIQHATPCGCSFELRPRSGYTIPKWISMTPATCAA